MKSRTRRMLERRRRKRRVKLYLYGNHMRAPMISPIVVAKFIMGQWEATSRQRPFWATLTRPKLPEKMSYDGIEIIWDT